MAGAALLDDVGQLVREQGEAAVTVRAVGALAKENVGPDGEGARASGAAAPIRIAIAVQTDVAEIAVRIAFEERPQRGTDRFASGRQHVRLDAGDLAGLCRPRR